MHEHVVNDNYIANYRLATDLSIHVSEYLKPNDTGFSTNYDAYISHIKTDDHFWICCLAVLGGVTLLSHFIGLQPVKNDRVLVKHGFLKNPRVSFKKYIRKLNLLHVGMRVNKLKAQALFLRMKTVSKMLTLSFLRLLCVRETTPLWCSPLLETTISMILIWVSRELRCIVDTKLLGSSKRLTFIDQRRWICQVSSWIFFVNIEITPHISETFSSALGTQLKVKCILVKWNCAWKKVKIVDIARISSVVKNARKTESSPTCRK